jgi:hypothetical protein
MLLLKTMVLSIRKNAIRNELNIYKEKIVNESVVNSLGLEYRKL